MQDADRAADGKAQRRARRGFARKFCAVVIPCASLLAASARADGDAVLPNQPGSAADRFTITSAASADSARGASLAGDDPFASASASASAWLEISTTVPPGPAAAERGVWGGPSSSAAPGSTASPRVEVTGWHQPPESASVGFAIGMGAGLGTAAGLRPPAGPDNRPPNVVDVGLRWRSPALEQRRIDIAAFRRVSPTPDAYTLTHRGVDQPLYGARVEMQFKSARFGGLTPELGAVGMQLEGGGKVVLRSKRGGPMVYYRSSF